MAQGTLADPMTLTEALTCQRVQPGHRLNLLPGVHRLSAPLNPSFPSGVDETTIAPYMSARAVIDVGVHNVSWTSRSGPVLIRDTDIRSISGTRRAFTRDELPNLPATGTRGWIGLPGHGSRIINTRFHDVENVGWSALSLEGTLEESQISNIGYSLNGASGGGHCMYAQNRLTSGWRVIRNCILGPSYGFVLALKGSPAAEVYNFLIENCIFLGGTQRFGQDGAPTGNIIVRNCVAWNTNWHFAGHRADTGINITFEDNYLGVNDHNFLRIAESSVQRNVFVAHRSPFPGLIFASDRPGNIWDYNRYITDGIHYTGTHFALDTEAGRLALNFADWQAQTGYDAHGAHLTTLPAENVHFVYPCSARVAHIAVVNWQGLDTVQVDVSGMMPGGTYRVSNAYDPLNDTDIIIYDGGGTIELSFVGRSNAIPDGAAESIYALDARFGAWIIERV